MARIYVTKNYDHRERLPIASRKIKYPTRFGVKEDMHVQTFDISRFMVTFLPSLPHVFANVSANEARSRLCRQGSDSLCGTLCSWMVASMPTGARVSVPPCD